MTAMQSFAALLTLTFAVLPQAHALHTTEILQDGAMVEGYVGDLCKREIEDGVVGGAAMGLIDGPGGSAVVGTAGGVVGASACAVEGTVVAAATLGAVVLDLGLSVGISAWDWYNSNDGKPPPPIKASARMLSHMKFLLGHMETPFKQMGDELVGLTAAINDEKWPEVAAKSQLAIARGESFAVQVHAAVKQAGCNAQIVDVDCDHHFYEYDGHTCWETDIDCYAQCCAEQRAWCGDDLACQLDRGCGPHVTHPPTFKDVNCEDLLITEAAFATAMSDLKSLHDCALELKGTEIVVQGCGKKFEQHVRAQVKKDFKAVTDELSTLAALYDEVAPKTLVELANKQMTADKTMTAATVLAGVATDKSKWEQTYAQVELSCQSLLNKMESWESCAESDETTLTAKQGHALQGWLLCIPAVVICVCWFIVFLLAKAVQPGTRDKKTDLKEAFLEENRGTNEDESNFVRLAGYIKEKNGQSVGFINTLFVVFAVSLVLGMLPATSPVDKVERGRNTPEMCEERMQYADNMYVICNGFAAALSVGMEEPDFGTGDLLKNTATGMAALNNHTAGRVAL